MSKNPYVRLGRALSTLMQLLEESGDENSTEGDILPLRDAAVVLAYRAVFLFASGHQGSILHCLSGDAPNDLSLFQGSPNDGFNLKTVKWLEDVKGITQREDTNLLARWEKALTDTGSVMLGFLNSVPEGTEKIGGVTARHRMLGGIYEQILTMVPSRNKNGIVDFHTAGDKKNERAFLGAHYTPVALVYEVVRPTFAARFARLWSSVGYDTQAYMEGLERLRVIDPAMGSAHFLTVAALELAREIAWAKMREDPRIVELPDWSEPLLHKNPIGQDPGDNYIDPDSASLYRRMVLQELPGVLQHSIFGVDIDPISVEIAKVSLHLFLLEQSGPSPPLPDLSFLDTNLQCGDSVIGLSLDEVTEVFEKVFPERSDLEDIFSVRPMAWGDRLREAQNTGTDSKSDLDWLFDLALFLKMQRYSSKASAKATAAVAELLLGRKPDGNRTKQRAVVKRELAYILGSPYEDNTKPRELAQSLRRLFREQDPAHPLRPFHWPLHFTAARMAGGFDAIVANPPFIGSHNVRGRIGGTQVAWLREYYTGGKTPDYAGFFLHRFAQEVGADGAIGTLSTNSIAQASNREYVLYPLLNGPWRESEKRLRLTRAVRSRVWPGEAKVHYAMIHLEPTDAAQVVKGRRIVPRFKDTDDTEGGTSRTKPDGEEVIPCDYMSSYLDDYADSVLRTLPSADGTRTTWTGINLRGNFSIHRQPGDDLRAAIGAVPENERDALAAYYNAKDVQHHGIPQASDVVVDFYQPLADAMLLGASPPKQLAWLHANYPTLLSHLSSRSPHAPDQAPVRSQRGGLRAARDNGPHVARWYLFGRVRRGLRQAWRGRNHVYAFGGTLKVWSPTRLPMRDPHTGLRICPTHALFIAPTDSLSWFAVVQSLLFESLVRRQCSTFKGDLRFTPTHVFPYFPYPWASRFDAEAGRVTSEPPPDAELSGSLAEVAKAARALLDHREDVLEHPAAHGIDPPWKKWGPTEIYNRYNDPAVKDAKLPVIAKLRRLHAKLLQAVLRAYGWDDLAEDSAHENWMFDHPWIDGTVRFVPPRNVRDAIYARIAALNAQRFEEEIALLLPLAKSALPRRAASAKKLRETLAKRNVHVSDHVAKTLRERLGG